MRDELEMLRLIVDSEKKKVKEGETETNKLSSELKKEKVEKKSLQDNYDKLKADMEKMIDSDRLQRGLLENENKEMRETVHRLRETANDLEGKLLEAQKVKSDPADQAELERLRQDNNNLLEELRRNMDEILELEKLKSLQDLLQERDNEIEALNSDLQTLRAAIDLQNTKFENEATRKSDLDSKLGETNMQKEILLRKNAKLEAEKRKLKEDAAKRDQQLEEKDKETRKALDNLNSVKEANLKLKQTIEKLSKDKEDLARKLDKVLNDLTLLKQAKDDAEHLFSRMKDEYASFKDTIAHKEEWILRQGNELKALADQCNQAKKKLADFKNETEIGSCSSPRVRQGAQRQKHRDHGPQRNDQEHQSDGPCQRRRPGPSEEEVRQPRLRGQQPLGRRPPADRAAAGHREAEVAGRPGPAGSGRPAQVRPVAQAQASEPARRARGRPAGRRARPHRKPDSRSCTINSARSKTRNT